MGCNCGSTMIKEKLGKCTFCMWTAFISTIVFWGLYFLVSHYMNYPLLNMVIFIYAMLINLLLAAHVLSFLVRRMSKNNES